MNDRAEATRHAAQTDRFVLARFPLASVVITGGLTAALVAIAAIVGLLLATAPEPIISAPIRL